MKHGWSYRGLEIPEFVDRDGEDLGILLAC